MTSLRVLVVSTGSPVAGRLKEAGHQVTLVNECAIAAEALQVQKFDVLVLGPDLPSPALGALMEEVRQLNQSSSTRTVVLGVTEKSNPEPGSTEIDGYLPERGTPEALSSALMNLAVHSPLAEYSDPRQPELSVLDAAELQANLDYDNELLIELAGLFFSERKRQSAEMQEALAKRDLLGLSRLAHTLKGSLGSLQASAGRSHAQLLEKAAAANDLWACECLLPGFESKLDELEVELQALCASLTQNR